MSVLIAAPSASCRADAADGPTPKTSTPAHRHDSAAAASIRVLPAPAGPTTVTTGRVVTSIAATASAWLASRTSNVPGVGVRRVWRAIAGTVAHSTSSTSRNRCRLVVYRTADGGRPTGRSSDARTRSPDSISGQRSTTPADAIASARTSSIVRAIVSGSGPVVRIAICSINCDSDYSACRISTASNTSPTLGRTITAGNDTFPSVVSIIWSTSTRRSA